MYETFKIETNFQDGDSVLLKLSGRLDAAAAQDLREVCLGEIDAGRLEIVLDLAKVPFVASSGLGTFLLVNETAKSRGGVLVLAEATATVKDVLKLMNIDRFFTFRDAKAPEPTRS